MEEGEYVDLEWIAESVLGTSGPLSNPLLSPRMEEDFRLMPVQFIDRQAGLCGLYGGQVRPPGDLEVGKMITLFEKTMYERLAAHEAKSRL